jgi:hypothetical protein
MARNAAFVATCLSGPALALWCGMESQQRSRRYHLRLGVSWTAWVKAGGRRFRCHTVDVSTTGAKLRPLGELLPGMSIQLMLHSADGHRLNTPAIVWRRDADGTAVLFLRSLPVHVTANIQRLEPSPRGWR